MKHQKPMFIAVAAALTTSLSVAYAADASSERTSMPDFCSNRDVTCVLPGGVPAARASGRGGVTTGNAGTTVVDSIGGTAGAASVPALPGETPSATSGVPTATSGGTTTSSTTAGTITGTTGGGAGAGATGGSFGSGGGATSSGAAGLGGGSGRR